MKIGGIQNISFAPIFGAAKTESKRAPLVQDYQPAQQAQENDFNNLMAQLDKIIQPNDNKQVKKAQNTDEQDVSSIINSITMPDITSLINELKSNPGELSSITGKIEEFLTSNYGGSVEDVLKNLLSVDVLPPQVQAAQDSIYSEIVAKLSSEVSDKLSANPFI